MLEKILNDRDMSLESYPYVNDLLNNLSFEERNYLLKVLTQFHEESYTCGTVIHGIYHVEKVLLSTFFLSRNIQEPYRRVLLDAALYHDIGRINNDEDEFHGAASANLVKSYIKDNLIYREQNNLILLKALMYGHCRADKCDIISFEDILYELDLLEPELTGELKGIQEIYLQLMAILKDADALDRKRFGDAGIASLNPRFLRINESHDLIPFCEEINALYYELMKANYVEIDESNIPEGNCMHSVGFDFFKINSVIKHGVLSQDEMKKRLMRIPRNFTGGNFDRWISVVDISLVKNSTAVREFVEHGVTFRCHGVKMHEPLPHNKRTEALEKGLPWNKSNHEDERYVLNRIEPKKIKKIIIPENYVNTSILDLIYLYNSLDAEIIRARVNYYLKQTYTPEDSLYGRVVLQYLAAYEEKIDEYLSLSSEERKTIDLYDFLNPSLIDINQTIAKMLYQYYAKFFESSKLDNITVLDVVLLELSQNKDIHFKQETFEGAIEIGISFSEMPEQKGFEHVIK